MPAPRPRSYLLGPWRILAVVVLALGTGLSPARADHRTQGPPCHVLAAKNQIGLAEEGAPGTRRGSLGNIRVPSLNPTPQTSTLRSIYLWSHSNYNGLDFVEIGWAWDRLTPPADTAATLFVAWKVNDAFGFTEHGTLGARDAPYEFRIRQNPDVNDQHRFLFKWENQEVRRFTNAAMTTGFAVAGVEARAHCESMYGNFSNLQSCRATKATSYCEWEPYVIQHVCVDAFCPYDQSSYWYVEKYAATPNAFAVRHCPNPNCGDQTRSSGLLSAASANCQEEVVPGQPCWSEWVGHAGTIAGGPDAASWGSGRLDVFARGSAGQLLHKWFDGGAWGPNGINGGWEDLGAPQSLLGSGMTSDPSAVSWGANRIDVFARGPGNELWTKAWNGVGWSGWSSLGAPLAIPGGGNLLPVGLTSAPDAASDAAGWIHVVARGPDNALWMKTRSPGGWSSDWVSLGGSLTADPSIVASGTNRFYAFGRGGDGAIWTRYWYGQGWTDWSSLGGQFLSGADAASAKGGRADVYGIGLDNALWGNTMNGGWSGWRSLGGVIAGDPGTIAWDGNRIDVFVRGQDGLLAHKFCSPC